MLHDYHYAYFVGTVIFWIAWAACFLAGKSYRTEIRWGTLLACPTALTSPLFVPSYWHPDSLFNLDYRIRIGIEDFLWAAAVGGIAAVIGEILLEDNLAAVRSRRHHRHYWPFAVIAVVFALLERFHRLPIMDNVVIAAAVGIVLFALFRPDLIPLMAVSTISFLALYLFLYLAVLFFYPDFVVNFYNPSALSGFGIGGVPIEELLFAGAFGSIWSVGYEYAYGYRLEAAGVI
jgi:hypothetical protein